MDLFRSEYGLQGAVGLVSCQDPSSNFFHFIVDVIYFRPHVTFIYTKFSHSID